MLKLKESEGKCAKMYVDLDVVYSLVKKDRHQEYANRIMSAKERKYTSIITLLELEIVIKREMSNYLSKETGELFAEQFPKIRIKPFNEKILSKSLEIRKKYDLGIFDSIHAATALLNDKRIASTDQAYKRINELKIVK